jgi:hypothetical protein
VVHPHRERHHLAQPAAGLAGREVLPHPPAQVARGAHVQHLLAGPPEQVHAGSRRQVGRHGPLAPLLRRDVRDVVAQLLQRLHAERADPLQQRVEDVDGGPRVRERPVVGFGRGPEQLRQRGQPAARGLLPGQDPASQLDRAQRGRFRPAVAVPLARLAHEVDVETRVVRHQHGAPRELEERG